SEEHTSELQSRENLVCRLLLEKKKGGPQGDRSPHPGKSGVRPPRFSSAGYDGGRDGPGDRSQPLHRPPLPGISRFRRGGRRRRFLRIGGKAGAAVCPEVRRKRGAEFFF